jgi:hypothetical protein
MEEGVVRIFFKPHGQAQPTANDIGLMARCAMTPAVFETFREPVTAKEIQICQNNLYKFIIPQPSNPDAPQKAQNPYSKTAAYGHSQYRKSQSSHQSSSAR